MCIDKTASIIIKSSNIFTAETLETRSGAVVISGDSIVDVISDEQIPEFTGPSTEVIDAGQRLVMPAFNDAHTHFITVGLNMDTDYTLDVGDCKCEDEVVQKVKAFADAHPHNAWVHCIGWNPDSWDKMPTKASLDKILPDRPCHIGSWDLNSCWANSKALELAGFTDGMESPAGSEICQDENGALTGILKEDIVNEIRGRSVAGADMNRALGMVCEQALSYGISSVAAMWPNYGLADEQILRIFKEAESSGNLPIRVHYYPKLEHGLDTARKFEKMAASDFFRFAGVKLVIDGVSEMHTAYLTELYADDASTCGELTVKEDEVLELVSQANSHNYSVRLHAIGNATVKTALNVYEAVEQKYGRKSLPNAIEHIESCCPEDLPRFAQLGVIASMQPIHSVLNVDGYPALLGEKWRPYMWPVASLLKHHSMLAFGTDAPVYDLNPMHGLYAAITRKQPWDGYPKDGFVPEQRISLAQALQAYTYGSAVVESFSERLGTLHAGKLADIVIMDRDLFAAKPEELLEAKPAYTIVGGTILYHNPESGI